MGQVISVNYEDVGGGIDPSGIRTVYFANTNPLNFTLNDVKVGDCYLLVASWSYNPTDDLSGSGFEIIYTETLGQYSSALRYWVIQATDTTMVMTTQYNTYSYQWSIYHIG